MLTSISPLGERARGNRFGVTATAHIVGSGLGGALVGGVAGSIGWLVLSSLDEAATTAAGLAVIAVAVIVAVFVDQGDVPTVRRQVDERWIDAYRGWVYGFGYGVQLGMGVVTIVPSALIYTAFAGAAATASPVVGVAVGAAFGFGRGIAVLLGRRVRTPEDLVRLHRRVVAAGPRAARLATRAAASVGVVAAAVTLGVVAA